MKLTITLIAFFAFTSLSHGQSFGKIEAGAQALGVIYHTKGPGGGSVDGTPFFNEEWQKGVINTIKGNEFELESIMYNVYLGQIIFLKDDISYALHKNLFITKFEVGNSMFEYLPYDDGSSSDFFQVMLKGDKTTLLKRFQCTLEKGKATTGMIAATNDRYRIRSEYYIKKEDSTPSKIRIKKDDLLEALSDKSDEVETYIKKNKIKLKDEDQLVKVFEFYNTL